MSSISVEPIIPGRDEKQFIAFAWKIYENNPVWVPPLLMDRRKLMDRKNNPFYKHADAEFFLAKRDGAIVGRIGAIVNHNHNSEHRENIGFFGFFECVNDQEVANALFARAKEWLKGRGVNALRGPATPSVNDEYGLLVDGFDRPPVVLMPYNPPYYPALIENAGFRKVKDMYAYFVRDKEVLAGKMSRLAESMKAREGLTFRSLNMKRFKEEIATLKDLYNRAWQPNWGAVPMTNEEFDALAKDLKPVVVPDLVIIAEYRGEPIGFALSLPDLNIALKYNKKGYLLPGLYCLYRHKKKINQVRIIVLGVVPERLKTGAGVMLFYETTIRAVRCGYPQGEASWVLEDNVMMNRGAEMMNAERTKTYRIYESPLS
jgi:hypothetical protein